MQGDRYTVKSQEALERAQRLAREHGHQELNPEHLLVALLHETDGTVAALLSKLGAARETLLARAEEEMTKLPRVQGGDRYLGERLRKVLDQAEATATSTSAWSTCWPPSRRRRTPARRRRCSPRRG